MPSINLSNIKREILGVAKNQTRGRYVQRSPLCYVAPVLVLLHPQIHFLALLLPNCESKCLVCCFVDWLATEKWYWRILTHSFSAPWLNARVNEPLFLALQVTWVRVREDLIPGSVVRSCIDTNQSFNCYVSLC